MPPRPLEVLIGSTRSDNVTETFFEHLIDSMWKSSYKSSAWRGVDQHLRVAVNLWIIVILRLYHLTWCTMNHGFRSKWDRKLSQYDVSYNHKNSIDSSTIWFNVEGLEYSTLMFIRNLSLRMMKLVVLLVILHQWMWTWCADKIRENLVIGYTTRPATSSHLQINFGSVPPNFGFRCLRSSVACNVDRPWNSKNRQLNLHLLHHQWRYVPTIDVLRTLAVESRFILLSYERGEGGGVITPS